MSKRFSQACENNKQVILAHIAPLLSESTQVLEVGSGTGQHAVYFAENMPHLHWQTADLPQHHDSIQAWIDDSGLTNVGAPLSLDVLQPWPVDAVNVVYTANTLHIMPWQAVQAFFEGLGRRLNDHGMVFIYGPFNMGGEFTSASNAAFDAHLKSQAPHMGIRDLESIEALATQAQLSLKQRWPMPANNQLLWFVRTA